MAVSGVMTLTTAGGSSTMVDDNGAGEANMGGIVEGRKLKIKSLQS
jgi:hypothetical protein